MLFTRTRQYNIQFSNVADRGKLLVCCRQAREGAAAVDGGDRPAEEGQGQAGDGDSAQGHPAARGQDGNRQERRSSLQRRSQDKLAEKTSIIIFILFFLFI